MKLPLLSLGRPLPGGQDFREFVLGVELLADPSGRGGCGIDHHSGIQRLFRFEQASFKYKSY
jgi:hypothetical protein